MADQSEIYKNLDMLLEHSFHIKEREKTDTEIASHEEKEISTDTRYTTIESEINTHTSTSRIQFYKYKAISKLADTHLESPKSEANSTHQIDQNIFLQQINQIIDQEIENIITNLYEYHIGIGTTSTNQGDLQNFEKNVIEF